MPAEVTQGEGFTVRHTGDADARTPAWHGLFPMLNGWPGRDEAIRLAGQDWTVEEIPIARKTTVNLPEFEAAGIAPLDAWAEIPGWRALTRSDTGAFLHVAADSYTVVQHNPVMWDLLDAIVDTPTVNYETGGTLNGGRKVWALAYLDEPIRLPGDPSVILPRITVSTAHDGTGAVKAMAHIKRVVCDNTMQVADGEARELGTVFTLRHTTNVMDRVAEAREVITGVRRHADLFAAQAGELIAMRIRPEGIAAFVDAFIPMPEDAGTAMTERVRYNINEARGQVRALFDTPTLDGIGHTAYGLWQAAVEYRDHVRPFRNAETYFGRCLMSPDKVKGAAAKLAKQVAREYAAI